MYVLSIEAQGYEASLTPGVTVVANQIDRFKLSASCTPGDTTTCATLYRPDPYTGQYDGLGSFKSPSTLTLGLQVAKDITRELTVSAIFTNIVQQCFTHAYTPAEGRANDASLNEAAASEG